MVSNSNAMSGIAPGTVISYTKAPWQIGSSVLIGLAVLFLLWVIGMIIYRNSKA